MIESLLSESESVSTGGGSTGGGSTVSLPLVSSVVSPLFPLSIKVLCGNGDPVMRVGLLLLVFAETGVASSDIQTGCIICKVGVFETKLIQKVHANKCQSFRMLPNRGASDMVTGSLSCGFASI